MAARIAGPAGGGRNQARRRRGLLKVAEYTDGSAEKVPFVIVNGKADGPSMWLTACEHDRF